MKKLIKSVISVLMAGFMFANIFSMCVFADENNPERKVRVGVGFNNALYLNEDGKLAGYFSLYVRQLEWLENWKLEFVEASWPEAVEKMRNGELDLLLPVQYSEERDEFMDFSEYSGGFESVGLYVPEDSEICFDEYDAFDDKCIGIESDNMCSQDLNEFAQKYNLHFDTKLFDNAELLDVA